MSKCAQIEIVIHGCGEEQAKFLVRGIDDVLWTDDPLEALRYVESEMKRLD